MKNFWVRSIFIPLLVAGFPTFLKAQDTVDVVANLNLAKNGHAILGFNLKNCGHENISIEYGNLPWNLTYTTIAPYLGVGFFGVEIPKITPPMDFPSHLVNLEPKESKQGEIDLNAVFPSLGKVNNYSELIVFWGYQLHGTNITSKKTFGGVLTLTQSDSHLLCEPK